MLLLDSVKQTAAVTTWKLLIQLLKQDPEKNLARLFLFAEMIPSDEPHKAQIRAAKDWFKSVPSSMQLLRILTQQVSRHCLVRAVENLFVRSAWLARKTREEFEKHEGFYPPFFMTISPIERCNLNCPGCYAGLYKKETDMSWELFDRLLSEGRQMGMHMVTISGGETFLYPHLFHAAQKYPDIQFHIYTNGTLIAPESNALAQKIHGDYLQGSVAQTIAKLGNMNVAISVEGLSDKTNARRGTLKGIPVWDLVCSAMADLRKEGCLFGYSVTETSQNIDEIHPPEFVEGETLEHPFLDMMISKGCVLGWHFNFIPCGKDATLDLMPTPWQRDQARRGTLKARATKPIVPLHFWNDGHLVGGCMAAGKLYCHILPNGEVEPCVFAHFAVDNVSDKPLKKVLNSPFFQAIRLKQPFHHGNHLRPCMIIDAPEVLREVVEEHNAFPTHEGAEVVISKLAPGLDEYTRQYGQLADPAWQGGYDWVRSGQAGVPK